MAFATELNYKHVLVAIQGMLSFQDESRRVHLHPHYLHTLPVDKNFTSFS